jgi:hypothetical protein
MSDGCIAAGVDVRKGSGVTEAAGCTLSWTAAQPANKPRVTRNADRFLTESLRSPRLAVVSPMATGSSMRVRGYSEGMSAKAEADP